MKKALNHFLPFVTFSCIISFSIPGNAQNCVERKPISVAIAIDVSGSMSGNVGNARNFATGLVNGLSGTGNLSEVEIFLFNDLVPACPICEYIWGSSSGAVTWVSNLQEGHAGGGTALYSATYVGATITKSRSASNFKLFVLLTDGEDDGSSTVTLSDAASQLSGGGLVSRLIFIGTSPAGASTLNSMASIGGSNCKALNSTPSNLNSLISEIVEATCVNHSPVANFSKSTSNLILGTQGFSINFDGSASSDKETSSSSLTYEWTFTRPDGSTFTRSDRTFSQAFTDNELNHGTPQTANYSVRLRVRDAKGVWSNPVTQSFILTGSPPNVTLSSSPASPIAANITAAIIANPENDIDGGPMTFQWTVVNAPAGGVPPTDLTLRQMPFSTQEENITTYSDGTTDFRTLWQFECRATDDEAGFGLNFPIL